ncbi:hypothetical protein KIN20_027549 [Parelaphostrongylus tenuis]|uniref:Uncharacterized protein n=1 Tax=Parelaphostrongylus tenuis TaxID=148309 RepID=A0AAD5WE15_PARTN|nr:hypothetical protein KIN20_027549 [Parelaphostrongylus tenuis]
MKQRACIIVDDTVTAICSTGENEAPCAPVPGRDFPKITPVPDSHLTISGSLAVCSFSPLFIQLCS